MLGIGSKKDVPGVTVKLKLHPDEVIITNKQNVVYYIFFSLDQKCLIITSKKTILDEIIKHLPAQNTTNNVVVIEATSIDPFVYFRKKQLADASKKLGVRLNEFKVYMLFNYSLTTTTENSNKQTRINFIPPVIQ